MAVTAVAALGFASVWAAPAPRVVPERALAGVRIGSRGIAVLQRFGEPTTVQVGNGGADPNAAGGAAGFGATPTPGLGGTSGPNPYATGGLRIGAGGIPDPRGLGGGSSGPGPLPPAGYGAAGPYGPGGGASAMAPSFGSTDAGGDVTQPDYSGRLITWTYRYPKQGLVLDFQLDEDGRVVQIVATGLRPTTLARTRRGVSFGDSYSKVLKLYGFPESQSQPGSGSVVVADYRNRARVAFQFINLKVVRIVVAELQ